MLWLLIGYEKHNTEYHYSGQTYTDEWSSIGCEFNQYWDDIKNNTTFCLNHMDDYKGI